VIAIKRGSVGVEAADRVVGAGKSLRGLPIWIEDGTGTRASTITVRSRAWRRKHPGPALVIVDHLHIVRPEDGDIRSGATYAVGQVSGALKRLSKSCHLPVIALAQLNRGVEGREDKRPGLADLRASGDIEQDADSVGFLYREEYYLTGEPRQITGETEAKFNVRAAEWANQKAAAAGKAELIWSKVRDGQSGTDNLRFDGPTTSFTEPEDEQ
jgi:replicative DNA helicase